MIRLEHIDRVFEVGGREVHALRDVDLTIGEAEYVSIMGPSGSGKSTLLNVLGILDRPTNGRYLLKGQDVTSLDEKRQAEMRRKTIGFVFQFFHLVPRLTAFDNVALPLLLAGIDANERRERVAAALRAVSIEGRGHHRPEQLSGGERQRVAIARATIMKPEVILADEPTGNLDRASSGEVVNLLEGLREHGISLVVVTHDPEVGRRAMRRIRMEDGGIVQDIYRQPGKTEVP